MSETVRTYSTQGGPRKRRLQGFRPRHAVLIVLLVLAGYAFWTTRDVHPIARFIPADQKYCIEFVELLETRTRIAQSSVWSALPESVLAGEVPVLLGLDPESAGAPPTGMFGWVFNNLVPGSLYLTGRDLETFEDVLVLSKMSRVGCLLERFHGLVPGVDADPAGGLGLRKVSDQGLYYAVRGRVLMASPSREALIRSLVLASEDAMSDEVLDAALGRAGREHVHGTVTLAEDDPLGHAFSSVGFAMRIDPSEAQVACRARLREAFRDQWHTLLDGAVPQPLTVPPNGMLTISADFGKPVRDVWTGLAEGLQRYGIEAISSEDWRAWEQPPEDTEIGPQHFFAGLLGPVGPGIRLSWCGVDLNEIVPVPEIAGTFDADAEAIQRFVDATPAAPDDALPWASFARYDEETQRVHLPMAGGPSIEPTAAPCAAGLLASTSKTVADTLVATVPTEHLPGEGNLYIHVRPHPCVEMIVQAGRLLVEQSLLRGHTPESYDATTGEWLASAASIEHVSTLVAVERDELRLDLSLVCTRAN